MPTRQTTVLTVLALCATVSLLALRSHGQVDASEPGGDGGGTGGGGSAAAPMAVQVAAVPPKLTELEKLATQADILVTKGFTVVGDLAGDDGSTVRVVAVQFTDAGGAKTRGLAVHVRAQSGREAVSYIDADEVPGLLSAVDSLANLQQTDTPLQEFEGHYSTRSEFEIANVNVGGGRMVGVRAVQLLRLTGQLTWASGQLRVTRMQEFGQLLNNAKQVLDGLGSK